MKLSSIWTDTSSHASFPSLSGDHHADVVVIGGGITGITAALHLSRAGKSVVVLEAQRIGEGTTGYSTGNLYASVSSYLYRIRDAWDQDTAAAVARSRAETIDEIQRTITEFGLNCHFARRPHYFIPTDDSQIEKMEREYEAVNKAGLNASIVGEAPLPLPVKRALKIENQAQFHPLNYVRLLAKAIASDRCRIFEEAKAEEIDDENIVVRTAEGSVHADRIIMATHTPKGFNLLQTELGPYREYGIAVRLKGNRYPEGIFWTLEEPNHSIRSFESDGAKYLIIIGEKHKTGQHEEGVDYYEKVEAFARANFDLEHVAYRWSAQHYRSADELPYIGKSTASENVTLATGFATNGLIYGPLAAAILTDEILGRENPWADLYSAKRFTPAKSAGDFLKENANVAVQYVRDYLTRAEVEKLGEIPVGEGRLAELEGKKLAVFRDEGGGVTVLSPVCTHLGCIVHWNGMEKTWDCPCHGSRFRPDGEVIEGPAIAALERKVVRDE